MTARLKSNKKNWEQLKRRLLRFDQRSFDVGFFKKEKYGPENDNMQVAEVAWMNDQGTSVVPPRPFFTIDFRKFAEKSFHKKAKHILFILLFKKNPAMVKELENLADFYSDSLREFIYDYPGNNSEWWAEAKGFDDPLYHTGVMVNAVNSRIVKRKA